MISGVLSGMLLFHTRKGYIGVAKQSVKPGDAMFIIPSYQVPVVMREVSPEVGHHTKSNSRRVFRIVSFAYLHGAMDGELLVPEDAFEDILAI